MHGVFILILKQRIMSDQKTITRKLTPAQNNLIKFITNDPLTVRDDLILVLQQLATHDGDRDKFTNPFNDDIYTVFELLKLQVAIIDENNN